jgi:hypothetical protein
LGRPRRPIGQQFQPQPDPHFLPRPARPGLARRAVGAGLVAGVAAPAIAAAQQGDALAGLDQVCQHGFAIVVEHLRADRHLDDKIVAARAGAVLARAAHAALRLEMLGVTEIDQGIEAGHRLEHDIAALAAFTAIGAAIFDVLFRRKLTAPGPPAPERMKILAWSRKCMGPGVRR